MQLSHSLSQTAKTITQDDSINAKLLTQAGFIQKEAAGVYNYLPFGRRVLAKVEQVVRTEMNALGCEEVLLPALTPRAKWQKTGRDKVEIAFRPTDQLVLGWSHEEIITPLAKNRIKSYRDLPLAAYQIQTKFRNEPRAKSGLLRGREFLMKDLYSFHANQTELQAFYEQVKAAYFKIFRQCGLKSFLAEASGGEFSDNKSHEFQVFTEAGEDQIQSCAQCDRHFNSVMALQKCPICAASLERQKAAEVGNIFDLGTKYSEAFGLTFLDQNNQAQKVLMACFGLGVSRLIAVVAEVCHDERGLVWPEKIAPFKAHLISLGDEKVKKFAEQIYALNPEEILFDERKLSAGQKFADADLLGLPVRLVVSPKTLAQNSVEVKKRTEQKTELRTLNQLAAIWNC